MKNERMVHMANQIAAYFNAYPQARARQEVLNHLRQFWEPRMRRQLVVYAREGGAGLDPTVVWAAEQLGQEQPVSG